MITNTTVQGLPATVDAYIRHGWKIVPIPRGTKGPEHAGWNIVSNCLASASDLPPCSNYGLAHAYSGTMALDVDEWDTAKGELLEVGIDLDALYDAPDAVTIESGRPGHGKLLYAMPFGLTLPSKKLIADDGQGGKFNYLDFRCATSNGLTVQDVLPASVHPSGTVYQWGGKGHWSRLPLIPPELLAFWDGLVSKDRDRVIPQGDIDTSWDEIRAALAHVPADINRDEWVTVGMALHYAGVCTEQVEQAFIVWDEWSSTSQQGKYRGQRDLMNSWRGFSPDGGVSLGSLFHIAKQHGWTKPMPSAEELFKPVTPVASDSQQEQPLLVDLLKALQPPAPEMDMSLWPELIQTRATEVSISKGCDPLIPLWAGVGAVCGAVNAESRLELMPGFQVPPILWIMTIGAPADKKTPGADPMRRILAQIEKEDRKAFKDRLLKWEGEEAAELAARKNYYEWSRNPETHLENDVIPEVPEIGEKPVPLKLVAQDITSQKLAMNCASRPEGMIVWLDEMRGWVVKLTNDRAIDDRSTWVQSYEGNIYEVDRVGSGSYYISNFAVSIYGNLQPKPLRQFLKQMGDDGLIQRFITVPLRSNKSVKNQPIPSAFTNEAQWEQLIRTIHSIPKMTYRLSHDAFLAYREFQDWYYEEKKIEGLLDADSVYMGAFGKLEGLVGRLTFIMHLMTDPMSLEVPAKTLRNVVELVKTYILPAWRYTLSIEGGLIDKQFDVWLTQYVIQMAGEVETLRVREIKHAARRQLENVPSYQRTQVVMDTMMLLEEHGYVALIDQQERSGQATWMINPALKAAMADRRDAVLKAKQERLDYQREHAMRITGEHIPRRMVKGYQG